MDADLKPQKQGTAVDFGQLHSEPPQEQRNDPVTAAMVTETLDPAEQQKLMERFHKHQETKLAQ